MPEGIWFGVLLKELSIKVSGEYLKEGLQAIEVDHGEYTLDGENMMAQKVILERDSYKEECRRIGEVTVSLVS